jgi:glycosyltransferase involved in cell wall biosynthesis
LLCVGRLIERKGQHHLIEAVKRLKGDGVDVTLDLVGTGDALRANQAQVKTLGLEDRVRFQHYVAREEINRYYAMADVFVLASYNEGMSVALLEAMAAGLPVVVTPTGGTDALVEPGVNGFLFDWGDIGALVDHLRLLARDRSFVRRMGLASRARVADFTWQAAADRYLEMFNQVVPQEPSLSVS